jgi:hypothetical protein
LNPMRLTPARLLIVGGRQSAFETARLLAESGAERVDMSSAGVGRDQHLDAVGGEAVHLLVVPVAGVGDHDRRRDVSAFEPAPTLDHGEGRAPSARLGQLGLGLAA